MIAEYSNPSSTAASLKGEKRFGAHKVPFVKVQKDLQGGVAYTEGKSILPPHACLIFKTESYIVD